MRMTLINPEMRNLNLIKEGAGPFLFYKYFEYDVTIVCYQNGDYPYVNSLVKGVHLKFIDRHQKKERSNDRSILEIAGNSVVRYLKENAQKIDVLQLVGFSKESLIYGYFYKLYNEKGICYLKCDADYGIIQVDYLRNTLKRNVLKYFFNKIDFYSVESSPVLDIFSKKYSKVLKGLFDFPVPYFFLPPESIKSELKKEKIILTVARLGSHQKNTELLLRAFSKLQLKDWTLVLIGPIENPNFKDSLRLLFVEFPSLESRIFWAGNIVDREEIFEWYQKSSIFCLPSRHESFGIALLEASYFGCYPITTGLNEVPAAYDITKNWEYGSLFPNEDESELLKVLQRVTSPEFDVERELVAKELRLYVQNKFSGKSVVEKLHAIFTKKLAH